MEIRAIKTRVFKENGDLITFILKHAKKISDKSILVITSKIVALSEGQVADPKNKEKLIKSESTLAINTKKVWLTIKDGIVMANAGIDESNSRDMLTLLPKDSFKTAAKIRAELCKKFKIKNLGVIISDSGLMPLRAGVVGVALGYAGFKGLKDYTGKKDIFGRKFVYSKTDVADSLATAATLCMGEGDEQKPLATITAAPVVFTNKINKKELIINSKDDIYAPLFNKLN